ncbi:MAG: DUF2269 domain-containing protein [Gallionellaceae bacterium]|jgi:uncharacterized membrane protein
MYEWLKLIHILSSVLMVGTGFGSAFYMFMANRSNNLQAQVIVSRLVVKADWWFTTPTVIIQPVSGFAMLYLAGWPMDANWLLWTYALYALAAVCWLPVVWLQIKMRNMALEASANSTALPALFWRYARYWEMLGYPAFVAMLAIYWLMVARPL